MGLYTLPPSIDNNNIENIKKLSRDERELKLLES
jgi:hypothetical protein